MSLSGGCGLVLSVVYASIAPSHLRARVIAVLTLIGGVVGGSGSIVYGAFTDVVLGDPARLYLTLSLLTTVLIVLSIIAGFIADRRYGAIVAAAIAAETIPNPAPADELHERVAEMSHG
jgi:hypothetical protein